MLYPQLFWLLQGVSANIFCLISSLLMKTCGLIVSDKLSLFYVKGTILKIWYRKGFPGFESYPCTKLWVYR